MNVREHNRVIDPARNAIRGIVRRMIVSRAAAVIWQIAGVRFLDGSTETNEAEVFQGIGFSSLPPLDGAPEAIVLNVGGPNAPAIVATRDEKTRAQVVPSTMAAGETVTYSVATIVYQRSTGKVEIRTPDGTAVPLALKSDVDLIRTRYNAHLHPAGTPNTAVPTVLLEPLTGTSVLLGM